MKNIFKVLRFLLKALNTFLKAFEMFSATFLLETWILAGERWMGPGSVTRKSHQSANRPLNSSSITSFWPGRVCIGKETGEHGTVKQAVLVKVYVRRRVVTSNIFFIL